MPGGGERLEAGLGDDRSVKMKSLEAAKIMKIKRLVLGCIEANFCKQIANTRWKALDENLTSNRFNQIYMLLHRFDLKIRCEMSALLNRIRALQK